MEYLFITSKTKLELLREQAEAATECKEKTDLALQQKSSECVNLQNEINGLSDKISALDESNSHLESRKNELIAELDNNKKETTVEIISKLKAALLRSIYQTAVKTIKMSNSIIVYHINNSSI